MLSFLQKTLIFLFLFVVTIPFLVDGQIRSSSNYQLERDSINIGGVLSSSTNYGIQDTVGEVGTGISSSTNYTLLAGYQQPDDTYITITSPADVSMDSISGLVGGTSTSSVSWTVTTNNNSGYSLSIRAGTSPAMKSSNDEFEDYTPTGANPDFNWNVSSTEAEFGYSVESSDVVTKFKDNGSSCNTGSNNTNDSCWYNFSTTDESISTSATANAPTGSETKVELQAESGNSKILTAGSYSATLTVTAVSL